MKQQEDYIHFIEVGKDDFSNRQTNCKRKDPKIPIPGDYESLYDELVQKCSPENFLVPYDKERLDTANEIYISILATETDDEHELKNLRSRAMKELGIMFATSALYEKLAEACAPKNYTGSNYNASKLSLANELYSRILDHANDIEELERIETEAADLIKETDNRKRLIMEAKKLQKSRKKDK